MPGFNQKGPEGQGPMTGRRMGKCTNYGAAVKNNPNNLDDTNQPATQIPMYGQGRGGSGRGGGRGRGFGGGQGRGQGKGQGFRNRFRNNNE